MASFFEPDCSVLLDGDQTYMTDISELNGVWFVYDGDCPICSRAAEATRIKHSLGDLHLLDARSDNPHTLMTSINKLRLNLDDGMVIFYNGHYFHGADALEFMAVHGAPEGLFNIFNRLLFRSKFFSKSLYPLMRGGRNLLIRLQGKPPLLNLEDRSSPIFQSVFGDNWHHMPPVMHKHYANQPFGRDVSMAKGVMRIEASPILRTLAPILRLIGGVPTYNETDIPVEVRFESSPHHPGLTFNRLFQFNGRKPYRFRSTMMPEGNNNMVERMKFGLGWRVKFAWQEDKVQLLHQGYALCLFRWTIPLPLDWLLGAVTAEEQATGESTFTMTSEINHPWWGKIYEYSGSFEMIDHA